MIDLIELYKKESAEALGKISNELILQVYNTIKNAYKKERTIFVCGNGGTVGAVANLVVDLNFHPFVSEAKDKALPRNKFKVVNLCLDSALITGQGNDLGFDQIFASQLKYQANKNDILIGMSGSGNSANIVEAFKTAKRLKMSSILFTRGTNAKAAALASFTVTVKGTSTFPGQTGSNNMNFHFEDVVFKISHILTGLLKKEIGNA
jgi:D-sedoheptulose 7-phosphate isomerase